MNHYVYVVSDGYGLVKIGVSKCPERRLSGLQTGNNLRLQLVAKFSLPSKPIAHIVERRSHSKLLGDREEGEWFKTKIEVAVNTVREACESIDNCPPNKREMPLLGDIKQTMEDIPHRLIVACKSKQGAIQLCVKYSCLQHNVIAELIGIDRGNFSRILSGSAYLPPNKEKLLQEVCGNKAIIDWCNWDWNQKAVPIDNSEKIAALEAELNQLREVG